MASPILLGKLVAGIAHQINITKSKNLREAVDYGRQEIWIIKRCMQ